MLRLITERTMNTWNPLATFTRNSAKPNTSHHADTGRAGNEQVEEGGNQ